MSALSLIKGGDVDRVPASLNDRLVWLMRFGKPKVGVYGGRGWHAHIDMNTNTTGTAFEVKSEFNHPSPEEAVGVLIERMLAALAAVGARP